MEIVGITSINMTFAIAFAYSSSERMNNFEFALSKVKRLLVKYDMLP